MSIKQEEIKYPYIPTGKTIQYVSASNQFLLKAKAFAKEYSLDAVMPTGSVVVKDGEVIGVAANGSIYHETHECERVKRNIPTGQGYELCEGCHPKNHSELGAIRDAQENGYDTANADLYLWGHWWCCEPCWNAMIQAGINNVFLMEGSEVLFNKDSSGNIVGRQFE